MAAADLEILSADNTRLDGDQPVDGPAVEWRRFVRLRFPDYFPPREVPCPDCGGHGRIARTVPGVPRQVCTVSSPCDRCWPKNPDGSRKAWDDGTAGTVLMDGVYG